MLSNIAGRIAGRLVACAATALACVAVAGAAEPATLDDLRLDQLQFIGTHNSYHVRDASPKTREVREWSYSHPPLDVQLDRGVRSFELDLHDRAGVFEVFHVPLLDEGTTCRRLADALATVRRWSEAHPRHLPISFLFELKKDGTRLDRRVREIDAGALARLDDELRAGFAAGQIITPDDVRGEHATLREAIEATGWPTVAASRGKVFFILHDDGEQRERYTRYHPSLDGRAMFVRSDDKRDDGATLVLDNPRASDIPRLAKAGYLIRTRADSDLRTSAPGQPARRDAAFASGAHIVSTDYPTGEAEAATGYIVEFPNAAPARANPVSAPEHLRGKVLSE